MTRTSRIATCALWALPLLCAPALLPTSGCARAAEQKQGEQFGRLSVDELEAKMNEAKAGKLSLVIYDNNSKDRYAKSHIAGAKWVQYDEIQAGDLPKDKGATLVFYCANEH